MPYVTCSCGVRLLYRHTPEGIQEHWSRPDVLGCEELKRRDIVDATSETKCARIGGLIAEDVAERRQRLAHLQRRRR
jgi:hypothetical protein